MLCINIEIHEIPKHIKYNMLCLDKSSIYLQYFFFEMLRKIVIKIFTQILHYSLTINASL